MKKIFKVIMFTSVVLVGCNDKEKKEISSLSVASLTASTISTTNTSDVSSSSSPEPVNACQNSTPEDGNLVDGNCILPPGVDYDLEFKGENYVYAWSDEFNDDKLNTNYWNYDIGRGPNRDGWGNNEQQYYREDNVKVENGKLYIMAERVTPPIDNARYASGRINTKDKVYFKYGYVEAKIELPSFNGAWPAFWMLGQNHDEVDWPSCGEIDIMEAVNETNKVSSTLHWRNKVTNNSADNGASLLLSKPRTEAHIYQLVWTVNKISMFADGNQVFTMDIGTGTEEFLKNFFFILNVAVGGKLPVNDGVPNSSIDTSKMPQSMAVDYVRVYQLA